MSVIDEDILDQVAAIRDGYAKQRTASLDQMELWAAQGNAVETNIHSTSAERHGAALHASNRILTLLHEATNSSVPLPVSVVDPEAGEPSTLSASSAVSPANLAPVDPATVEGACRHAPPAFQSQAKEPEANAECVKDHSAMGSSRLDARRSASPATGPDPVPFGFNAGAIDPGREPIDIPILNPLATSETVVGNAGALEARATGAGPLQSGPASSSDFPDIPDFLRRKRSAA